MRCIMCKDFFKILQYYKEHGIIKFPFKLERIPDVHVSISYDPDIVYQYKGKQFEMAFCY